MKLSLFLKVLVILGIAIIGLFFVYNNHQQEDYQGNIPNEPKNEEDNTPQGGPKGDPDIEKQIKVDLSQQKLYLLENGQIVMEYPISSGKLETPTPTGEFRVIHKQDMVYSKPTGCWLTFWVGFTMDGKYGFHETPVCSGKRVGEDKMGIPDSAGCIRLKLGEAEEFYNWVEIETSVEIYGQTR